ncbi:CAP domain-containing protein [Paenibacillus sp. SAF-054]|uniref:CAP domain-containing protein n=1 Tax=unclassified Paenibacillus TaxID=185978 RepID=UPI003F7D3D6E
MKKKRLIGLGPGARRLVLASVMAAGLLGGNALTDRAYAAADAGITPEQSSALAQLNGIRAKLGLPSLKHNAHMSKAAKLHAEYYNANRGTTASLDAHREIKGLPGFRGITVVDRLKASGWLPGPYGYMTGEVMHYEQASIKEAVEGWLDTAYHREIILSHRYQEVGMGLAKGTAVLDMAGPYDPAPIKGGIAVYPYDSMKNVGLGFYGLENPNPIGKFHVKATGYIISATTQKEMVWHQARITDSNGREMPYFEELHGKDTLFLYPKSVLRSNHTYHVSLSYEMKGSPGKKQKKWSFTTGEASKQDIQAASSAGTK